MFIGECEYLFDYLRSCLLIVFFFFNDTATTEIYTLSLHDALPICWNMGLQTGANEFLNMELLEHRVANRCKSVSKYGTVET